MDGLRSQSLEMFATLEILAELAPLSPRAVAECAPPELCYGLTRFHDYTRKYRSRFDRMATTAVPSSEDYTITPIAFPARTKTASSSINGLETSATAVNFADKILITVTQDGRLAHWVYELKCISFTTLANDSRYTSPLTFPQQTPRWH